jgi:hypothetical protein
MQLKYIFVNNTLLQQTNKIRKTCFFKMHKVNSQQLSGHIWENPYHTNVTHSQWNILQFAYDFFKKLNNILLNVSLLSLIISVTQTSYTFFLKNSFSLKCRLIMYFSLLFYHLFTSFSHILLTTREERGTSIFFP